MAFCVVAELPNGTQADYDKVTSSLGYGDPEANFPPGLVSHRAGPLDGGGWCVISEWRSREDYERFREERLRTVFKNAGVTPPQMRTFEVYREYNPERESIRRAA